MPIVRARLGRSVLALTLVLVAVLAALAALAWLVSRGSTASETGSLPPPAVELPGERPAETSPETPANAAHEVERSANAVDPRPGLVAAKVAPGTLQLCVLDARTRARVPGLGFVVYRERGSVQELAYGKTDAQGCARIEGLEPDTLLVRTERKPPYAATTAGLVLASGRTQELEIEVGPGSVITGRVVDERKLPVAQAAIFLGPREKRPRNAEPLLHSGPDGRFRIECASSHPSGVSVADGALLSDKLEGEPLQIRHDDVEIALTATIEEGKETDLGDIELSRATIFSGRVVDPDGVPVEGALLSPFKERMQARGGAVPDSIRAEFKLALADPAFQLLPGEQLTVAGGHFELRGNPKGLEVVVETRAGALQNFLLPAASPGERKEEIELKLSPMTLLEIELVDARGERIRSPAATAPAEGVLTPWRTGHLAQDSSLYVLTTEPNGIPMTGLPSTCDADGIWRVQVRKDPQQIEDLRVILSGYQPVSDHVAGRLRARTELHYELAPFPRFHLRLVSSEVQGELLGAPGLALELHVCLATPERHGAPGSGTCCGFGAFWDGNWRGETRAIVLPVRRAGSFWIYASVPSPAGGHNDLAHFGPFEPGEEQREIALDPRQLLEATRLDPQAAAADPRAQLVARIVDEGTRKGIPGALLRLSETSGSARRVAGAGALADEKGLLKLMRVPAGAWEIRAAAQGYLTTFVGVREIARGQPLDLGTIALAPAPVHRGRVLAADGTPLANVYLGFLHDTPPDAADRPTGPTRADGGFELFGDLPPNFVLVLGRRVPGIEAVRYEFQRRVLQPWPVKEVQDVVFAPARQVVVTLYGLDPEETGLIPMVCPAQGDPTSACDHRKRVAADHLPLERGFELDSRNKPPKYAFLLAPGRYQFWGGNMLHELPLTDFEVRAGAGDLELPIVVR